MSQASPFVPVERVAAEGMRHLAAVDPVMARLVDRYGPPALRSHTRHFPALVGAIVGQQLSVKVASAIRSRVEALMPPGHDLSPERVLALSDEQLRGAGLSRAKLVALRDLSEKVLDGAVDLDAIVRMPDDEAAAALVVVKGIGRWTADMFLIFTLGRPDVLPVGDLGVRLGAMRAYGLPAPADATTLVRLAEPWRPFRTLGAWYLWRTLENTPD